MFNCPRILLRNDFAKEANWELILLPVLVAVFSKPFTSYVGGWNLRHVFNRIIDIKNLTNKTLCACSSFSESRKLRLLPST